MSLQGKAALRRYCAAFCAVLALGACSTAQELLDGQGKKVDYTVKELEIAKMPAGMPYYAAARGDLQNGSQVEVHLVRLKEIPAAKVAETDLVVKYVVIHSLGSTGTAGANDPKKK